MKKFIMGFIAIIIAGIVIVALPKHKEGKSKVDEKAVADSVDEFSIEILSDEDIYFKADTVLPDHPVINDMIDLANGYAIMRAVYCDAELWFRFGMIVTEEIRKIKTDVIKDLEVRKAADKYVKSLTGMMPRDTALWDEADSLLWDQVWNAYTSYGDELSKRFALNRYGEMTKKDVENYLDKENITSDFDRECVDAIKYAHEQRSEMHHPAIPLMEKLMASGHYSRFLPEVWRTWRCMKQIETSASRDGTIMNLEYNPIRYQCLQTILKEIVKNPKNVYAINDFCFLASYDNIVRYSEFPYGNSAVLEQLMLFPEKTEEDDS